MSAIIVDSSDGKLMPHLREVRHYFLLPESAWDLLLSWYGIGEGSHPIPRYESIATYCAAIMMCVCIYVYVWVCMYVCAHVFVCVCACMYVCVL